MKLKVYVAGPYTHGDCAANVANAIAVGDWLARHGFVPFVPHLTHLWHLILPHPVEFWYDYDNEWLPDCNVLLRLDGESVGADAEVKLAQQLGKPVYFGVARFAEVFGIEID